MIRLFVDEGQKQFTRLFAGPDVSIGRSEENDLRLADPKVSRRHCKLEKVADGYKVVDLGSTTGTSVNGVRVSQKRVEPGDRIEIGTTTIHFQKGPETADTKKRRALDLLEERLRQDVDEFERSLGKDGLYEAERIFSECLDRHGFSYLKEVEEGYRNLQKILELARVLSSELETDKLLKGIVDAAVELSGAARGFVILFDEHGLLQVPVARNFDQESIKKPAFKISRSIAEEVGIKQESILLHNAEKDEQFSASLSVADLHLSSVLCSPIRFREQKLGVIYLDNPFQAGVFTEKHLALLEAFAAQAAVAIVNSLKFEKVRAGAVPSESAVPARAVSTAQAKRATRAELKFRYEDIIGESPRLMEVLQLLDKVVESDVPILIQGESGTGKELVARAIHKNSARKDKPFVSENCSAIPETLLESELFGYKRGSFTGADRDKSGLFEQAHKGTMFLDEIGDMSLEMQKKLLRALQDGEIRAVGGKETIRVDVRVISASNKLLRQLIQEGKFREDLYYRINVITVTIPPLRERREDIPMLVDYFLTKFSTENHTPKREISEDVVFQLMNREWRGNIRELENTIRKAVALSDGPITVAALEDGGAIGSSESGIVTHGKPLKEIVRQATERVEREAIFQALQQTNWKKMRAAEMLGISRPTLDAKIDAYKIRRDGISSGPSIEEET
ncbi:MAG: sigma 54-interacting transcriptional regulator [Planctomycetes bacterium]|nr:sigma 54-interacting transcriptional regulator [Planctomycetota bacterium]